MKEASNHAEEFVLVGPQHRHENLCLSCMLDVHGSMHHDTNLIEMTNKMQLWNNGIINCPTQLHLVGHFYKIPVLHIYVDLF